LGSVKLGVMNVGAGMSMSVGVRMMVGTGITQAGMVAGVVVAGDTVGTVML